MSRDTAHDTTSNMSETRFSFIYCKFMTKKTRLEITNKVEHEIVAYHRVFSCTVLVKK